MTERDSQPTGRKGRRWERCDSVACGAFVVALAASRTFWIAGAPHSSQYWEEGYRWLALAEIMAGAPLPLLDFQADHYQGGSLVMIGLALALSSLGVAPLAALKAVAVSFGGPWEMGRSTRPGPSATTPARRSRRGFAIPLEGLTGAGI